MCDQFKVQRVEEKMLKLEPQRPQSWWGSQRKGRGEKMKREKTYSHQNQGREQPFNRPIGRGVAERGVKNRFNEKGIYDDGEKN